MEVIYSDSDIIVINKPPGISVHPSSIHKRGKDDSINMRGQTLVDFLWEKFPEVKNVGEDQTRPGIVHRLDKDTSGVMVAARNQTSFEVLKDLFKKRLVEKTYLAIVCGRPKEKRGVISLPIGRLRKNPLKRGVESYGGPSSAIRGAREAITEYKVLNAGREYSLIEVTPRTGRMHQLRVHLKAIGHPVACDKVYGGKNVCCPKVAVRQLLHAKSLSFSFPEGRRLAFEADPPEDFKLARELI